VSVKAIPRPCKGCSGEHIGPRCAPGTTLRQRLRSVRIDPSATPTKTRRAYYSQEAVESVFGPDSKERMLEETRGLGAARTEGNETFTVNRHTGEWERLDEQTVDDVYMGGATEREFDPATD
jgi:hypothetical protein